MLQDFGCNTWSPAFALQCCFTLPLGDRVRVSHCLLLHPADVSRQIMAFEAENSLQIPATHEFPSSGVDTGIVSKVSSSDSIRLYRLVRLSKLDHLDSGKILEILNNKLWGLLLCLVFKS